MTKLFLLTTILMISAAACTRSAQAPSDSAAAVPTALSPDHVRNEIAKDKARFANEEMARPFDVRSYRLTARYDWEAETFHARLTIRLQREAGAKMIELDSDVTNVANVRLEGHGNVAFTVFKDKSLLRIEIPESVTASELELAIAYDVRGPNGVAGARRSFNLRMVKARKGDPAQSRVLFTSSEPRGASAWMPCNNRPSDRALFATEFTMPADERMISNGRLVKDETHGAERVVAYSTEQPIPTYLMAFAQGQFVMSTRMHGSLPVSIWARRGVIVDWDSILDETVRQISHFEKLLTPYPFEKYAIVLLPEFGGGMENASITFNSELNSSQTSPWDFGLMAHELGHQWFGDAITVRTWDDLWIKEGMATLLASEAARHFEDRKNSGILMGTTFTPANGKAVRDRALRPEEKYNTGPYDRAGWYLTQIRAAVGDDVFWRTLRELLQRHAYGTISSDEFLAAFRPSLGETNFKLAAESLDAHELPRVVPFLKDGVLEIKLDDPEHTMFQPIAFNEIGAAGEIKHWYLHPGETVRLERTPAALISVDPLDIHSPLQTWVRGENEKDDRAMLAKELAKLVTPTNSTELAIFKKLNPAEQWPGMNVPAPWRLSPSEMLSLHVELGSDQLRSLAIGLSCAIAKEVKTDDERLAWLEPIELLMSNPVMTGMGWEATDLLRSNCRGQVPASLQARIRLAKLSPAAGVMSESELGYLMALPIDNPFDVWKSVAENGRSLRNRLNAIRMLAAPPPGIPFGDDLKAFFRRQIVENEVTDMAVQSMIGSVSAKDLDALKPIAVYVRSSKRDVRIRQFAVCAANWLAADDSATWDGFVRDVSPLADLPAEVQETIQDRKAKCEGMERW